MFVVIVGISVLGLGISTATAATTATTTIALDPSVAWTPSQPADVGLHVSTTITDDERPVPATLDTLAMHLPAELALKS
jgi:hypothetical protein